MALLGINAVFDNSDLLKLQLFEVNLGEGYIKNFRSKTKELRFATLWPETVAALRLSLEYCHTPVTLDAEDQFFVTFDGGVYVGEGTSESINDIYSSYQEHPTGDRLLSPQI